MAVAVWCLAVGALTVLNLAVVRAAYRREKNAPMSFTTTAVLAVLLVVLYAALARAVVTG